MLLTRWQRRTYAFLVSNVIILVISAIHHYISGLTIDLGDWASAFAQLRHYGLVAFPDCIAPPLRLPGGVIPLG